MRILENLKIKFTPHPPQEKVTFGRLMHKDVDFSQSLFSHSYT